MLDLINHHVAKIAVALREGDSVLAISRRTGSSYGWTYRWIRRLEEIGAVERKGEGLEIKDRMFVEEFRELARSVLRRKMELKDAYLLPNFSGMKYAFTKTDAVFIWTKGGYQLGRSRKDYPIFIKVLRKDLEGWKKFFREFSVKFGVEERVGSGIYFVLFPEESFSSEWVENARVTPLEETVEWAEKHRSSFQPALEMLDEMYDLGLRVRYS